MSKRQRTETRDTAGLVGWSELPEELLQMIADRLVSGLDLIHFRCVCKSWNSSAASKPFPRRPLVRVAPFTPYWTPSLDSLDGAFLSRAAFFRVTLRLDGVRQGWLIRSEQVEAAKTRLVCPLTRFQTYHPCDSLDMSEFKVCEIREAYTIKDLRSGRIFCEFKTVVLDTKAGRTRVVGVDWRGKLGYWCGEAWTRNADQRNTFSDIIVHGGLIHAVDSKGMVWRVNSSPRVPYAVLYASELEGRNTHRNFVESCGELYIVDRVCNGETREGGTLLDDDFAYNTAAEICESETVGFKVYKLNKECERWEEMKSLGERAFVMATDCCFSVEAWELYKCEENSIYFIDHKPCSALNGHDLRVFKLGDGSIRRIKSSYDYFHMFSPSFKRSWGCWM